MGRDLAERFPAARDTFAAIDDALDVALSRLMWEGPEDELTLTHNTQPAILAHSAAVWAVVGDRLRDVGAAAGHSLGEYSAHVAAGTLTATTAASLVRRRGELMYAAGEARPGAMAAVLGLATTLVDQACNEASGQDGVAVAANLNAPDQTVISGDPAAVGRAGDGCKARGAKRVVPLKVSGAFHSPLMAPAVDGLHDALTGVTFADPVVPRRRQRERAAGPDRVWTPSACWWISSPRRCAGWSACRRRPRSRPAPRSSRSDRATCLSGLLKRIVPGAATLTLGTADEVEKFLG